MGPRVRAHKEEEERKSRERKRKKDRRERKKGVFGLQRRVRKKEEGDGGDGNVTRRWGGGCERGLRCTEWRAGEGRRMGWKVFGMILMELNGVVIWLGLRCIYPLFFFSSFFSKFLLCVIDWGYNLYSCCNCEIQFFLSFFAFRFLTSFFPPCPKHNFSVLFTCLNLSCFNLQILSFKDAFVITFQFIGMYSDV